MQSTELGIHVAVEFSSRVHWLHGWPTDLPSSGDVCFTDKFKVSKGIGAVFFGPENREGSWNHLDEMASVPQCSWDARKQFFVTLVRLPWVTIYACSALEKAFSILPKKSLTESTKVYTKNANVRTFLITWNWSIELHWFFGMHCPSHCHISTERENKSNFNNQISVCLLHKRCKWSNVNMRHFVIVFDLHIFTNWITHMQSTTHNLYSYPVTNIKTLFFAWLIDWIEYSRILL